MAAKKDELLYFGLKARAEATRMLYAIAGRDLEDNRITGEQWAEMKPCKNYIFLSCTCALCGSK